MLHFVLQKLINRKWMAVCLLIGNILLIAVTVSNPVYSEAILQRSFTKRLASVIEQTQVYPATLTAKATITKGTSQETLDKYDILMQNHEQLPDALGIPVAMTTERFRVSLVHNATMSTMAGFRDHIELLSGTMPSGTINNGVIETVVSTQKLADDRLLVGQSRSYEKFVQPDGVTPYEIKVVGVYRIKEGSELFWNDVPQNSYFIDEALFDELFRSDPNYSFGLMHVRTINLDYTKISPSESEEIIRTIKSFDNSSGSFVFSENLTSQLKEFQSEATRLKGTLTVLQMPIFALLAAFIFMVSKQMMELEENEIAVLKSRGSMSRQILTIYSIQAAIMTLAGLVIGYPLGFLLCHLLGSCNSFMEFIQRTTLTLRFTGESVMFALGAGFVAMAAMILPVTRYTRVSIVHHKQNKYAAAKVPLWQRLCLDIVLIALSLYGYSTFNGQQAFLSAQMEQGNPLNPLLYFSSSIFILGVGLFGIRLMPLVLKLFYRLGKAVWPPAVHTAFLRVLRNTKNQSFIMIFLILTIALGMYNTDSARSINYNAEAQLVYLNGTDVMVKEGWQQKELLAKEDESGSSDTNSVGVHYIEPSFEKYKDISGLVSIAKVYKNPKGWTSKTVKNASLTIMAIDSKSFGETANFDDTLMNVHWYHYLNSLAQDPNGLLLSSSYKEYYEVGDLFSYVVNGISLKGVVYGFVDYWPGFTPQTVSKDGYVNDNYLVVANLAHVQNKVGVTPYEIWMNFEDSTQGIYDFSDEWGKTFHEFCDTNADLIKLKNEPVLQGTNGVLTTNFIVVLLLCGVGFLIYWILSIRSRELQFGIYRAMGMSVREILGMLLCEQLLISGSSILIGVLSGSLVIKLFLPLIQAAYSGTDQILPVRIVSQASDSIRLFVIIGLMIVVCMVVLIWLISKIHIAQALKLGED